MLFNRPTAPAWRFVAVLLYLTAAHVGAAFAKDPTLWELTPEHFRDTATLKDGPLDTTAIISTQPGFVEKHGLLRVVWNDTFLRAFIDKASHQVHYQVYTIIYYGGEGWRFYSTVNYQTPAGIKTAQLTTINREVLDCSGVGQSGCSYVEHVGFDADEGLLRLLAASYVPGAQKAWVYKFSGRTTDGDYTDGLAFSEISGLLQRVDAYVATLPPVQAQAPSAPSVAANSAASASKVVLGVSFVDLPPQSAKVLGVTSGVIVAIVNPGSVAEKAGLHVGDVVTAYGETPISTIVQLKDAVGTTKPGDTITIAVHRGTTNLQVSAQY